MSVFESRCEKAQKIMLREEIDYLFLGCGSDMKYLSNYECNPSERLSLFILPTEGKPTLIAPAFEVPRLKLGDVSIFFDLMPWEETVDPISLVADLVDYTKPVTIAIDGKHWGMFVVRYLKRLPKANFVSTKSVLGEMRIRKDAEEIRYLKQLGRALDKVWEEALTLDYSGRRETELQADLFEIKKRIFKPPVEFSPRGEHRPTSGINSSSAHGGGSERVIQPSDAIYWEMGRGRCGGYIGDKTRSIQVSPATEEYKKIYEIVKSAQRTAFEAIRPGVTCESVDVAGRQIIEKAGYGMYFTHRIGHGLGLDVHEPPYIVGGNKMKLEPGMVFSVEPGIYLPNKWGVRIEDIVHVTEDGAESFYSSTKEFHEVK